VLVFAVFWLEWDGKHLRMVVDRNDGSFAQELEI
jgi:hypothetical protein